MSFQADNLPYYNISPDDDFLRPLTSSERRILEAIKKHRAMQRAIRSRKFPNSVPERKADSEWAEKEEIVQTHLDRLRND